MEGSYGETEKWFVQNCYVHYLLDQNRILYLAFVCFHALVSMDVPMSQYQQFQRLLYGKIQMVFY